MTDSDARPSGETLHCLDLFSGLGGFSSAFEDSGRWNVSTVDIQDEFDPDITADVLELRPDELPDADLVVASPPCKCFSKAAAWSDHFESGAPQTAKARESVALVYHTLGLIKAIDPDYWFVENPMGSKIKQYLGEPKGRVTYCQYGTSYQKATYLWGDHPSMTYRWCSAGDDCHEHGSLENERDERPLPRDPAERAKVPYELSESIRDAVEEAIDTPQPEQSELPLMADGGARSGHDDGRDSREVEINIETELWSLITEELQQELWDPLASIATGKGDRIGRQVRISGTLKIEDIGPGRKERRQQQHRERLLEARERHAEAEGAECNA